MPGELRGEIDALRALEMTFAANAAPGVITLATHALETLPHEWQMARSESWLQLAVAHLAIVKGMQTGGDQFCSSPRLV